VGFGMILHETLKFSNELDILHKHITKNNLGVQKSDYFEKQCFLLERHIGEEHFKSTHKKLSIVNIMLKSIAFSVLFVILGGYIYVEWINKNVDVFKFILNNPAIYIISAFLLGIILILNMYNSILRKKLYYKIYPELKRKLMIEEATFD
jgi:hypothetical protein